METTTVGQWIKRLRAEQDLTQEKVAELVGCSTLTLRFIEIGKRRPSEAMAERIATALQVPAAQREEFLRLARLSTKEAPQPPQPQALAMYDRGQVSPALPAAAHPRPGRIRAPQELSLAATSLIGRETEINTLTALLCEENQPLVTIVGPGGMGKTRLAQQVALKLQTHFADGAAFVPLASVAAGQNVPATIADVLRISLQQATDVRRRLLESLAERHLLLVLDNFEHLLAPTPAEDAPALDLLRQMLQETPNVRLLVTSRERLRIGHERIFELTGLTTPRQTAIEQADAVLLFVERAQQSAGHFALTAANQAAVARICTLLEGMPLAIELAAAWVRVLSCAEIADELQRNIDFLTLADRDMEPRHRSMKAVFDHSWSLLREEERQVLAQLSVFRGGCRREAAQAVARATLPLLASLIDKSLLTKRVIGANTRYEMHELVRQYGAAQLRKAGAEAATQRRHALLYLALAEEAHPALRRANQVHWLTRLGEEHDNLRTVLAWSLENSEVESAARIGWALWPFWWIRNYHSEGRQWMEAILAHKALLPLALRTRATMAAEAMAYGQGDGHACERYARELMELSRLAGRNAHAEAYAHAGFGLVATLGGQIEEALHHLEQALPLFQEAGEEGMAAQTHTWIGTVHLVQGDDERALPRFEAGLAYARSVGDRLGITNALFNLGQAALAMGKLTVAKRYFQEGIPHSEDLGDRANIAYILEGLAAVAGVQGEAAHAAQLFGAAHGLIESTGLRGHTYYQPDHDLYDRIRQAIQSTLGETRYTDLWTAGQAMNLAQMMALGRW